MESIHEILLLTGGNDAQRRRDLISRFGMPEAVVGRMGEAAVLDAWQSFDEGINNPIDEAVLARQHEIEQREKAAKLAKRTKRIERIRASSSRIA